MVKNKFIIYSEVNFDSHKGISRKYEALAIYLKYLNYDVFLVDNKSSGIYSHLGIDYLSLLLKKTDNLYLRNNTRIGAIFSFLMLLFFYKILKRKVIIEIPTWPYISNEYSGIRLYLSYINFHINLIFYRIFTFELFLCSPNKFNCNIKFKRITNWIPHWNKHPFKPETLKYDFVYIANMNSWHNPKELINKFALTNCSLLIISPKKLNNKLTKLIQLKENIINKYDLSDKETSFLLNSSLIGIDTIGRSNGNYSLKSRDYLYFGLSVIHFHKDDYLEKLEHCFYYETLDNLIPDDILKYITSSHFTKGNNHEISNNFISLQKLNYFVI